MTIQDPVARWNAVIDENKNLFKDAPIPTPTPTLTPIQNFTPNLPQSQNLSTIEGTESIMKGGSINIFKDENMNAAFNNLKGESQAQILQMEPEQRNIVMQQIMLKSARYSGGLKEPNRQIEGTSESPLTPYFDNLPLKHKLGALQGGYKAVSSEFSRLAEKVDDVKITINKQTSVQEELENKFPVLFVKKDDDKNETTSTSTNTTSEPNDSPSEKNDTSSSGIKKITI